MSGLHEKVKKYTEFYALKWDKTLYIEGMLKKQNRSLRRKKQRVLSGRINGILRLFELAVSNDTGGEAAKGELKDKITELAKAHLNIKNPAVRKTLFDGIMNVTDTFIKDAKEFDGDIEFLDIMQAMRNVWIMNVIGLLYNGKIEYTKSIFAYSMLYPYTDNLLDDVSILQKEKNEFNIRLGKWLKGESAAPCGEREEKTLSLVKMIEVQYDRKEYPDVFESIISIHNAQKKSLDQQKDENLSHEEILKISCEKGGTSVLADAYLVLGALDDKLFNFWFGYGVMLQLIDDMQDAVCDLENSHMTLFSKREKGKKLDDTALKLIAFVEKGLDYSLIAESEFKNEIKRIISENCILMIFQAAAKNRKCYSKKFLRFAGAHSLLGLKYLIKTDKKIKRRYRDISKQM